MNKTFPCFTVMNKEGVMKEKLRKFISISTCIATVCCMAGCIQNKNETGSASNVSTEENSKGKTVSNQSLDAKIEIATRGCEVVREGEKIQQGSLTYKVNSVQITKQTGDWYNMSGAIPKVDENGKITEKVSYVVINVTIKDDGDYDFWWNMFSLSYFEDDDLMIGPEELVSAGIFSDYSEKEREDKDVYQYKLPQGKEVTTDLIFVMDDSKMKEGNHFLLELNPTGAGLEYVKPEEYSMVFLNTMEDVCNGNVTEK